MQYSRYQSSTFQQGTVQLRLCTKTHAQLTFSLLRTFRTQWTQLARKSLFGKASTI
jgi:hypothetical protein